MGEESAFDSEPKSALGMRPSGVDRTAARELLHDGLERARPAVAEEPDDASHPGVGQMVIQVGGRWPPRRTCIWQLTGEVDEVAFAYRTGHRFARYHARKEIELSSVVHGQPSFR
jgi:hypothetical protein